MFGKPSTFLYLIFFFSPVLRPLTKSYQEVVRSVFTSSTSSSGASRRQTMKDLQEEFSNLYNNIRLFEKGTKYFTGIINKYFKNTYSRILNLLHEYAESEKNSFKKVRKLKDVFTVFKTDLVLMCTALYTHIHSLHSVQIIMCYCPFFWSVYIPSWFLFL